MATQKIQSTTVANMTDAASKFVDSLSKEQKSKACFNYFDGEKLFWYYPPLSRHGLALKNMAENQRDLAFNLLATGLTQHSYSQARKIIDLEDILGELEQRQNQVSWNRDPELYYFTIFGNPSDSKEPWGWRAEGHHISVHFSIWNGKVISMTPFFFGSNPAEVRQGPKNGQRVLSKREDLAYALMNELDTAQKSRATIYDEAPWDIVTYNSSKVSLPKEEGLYISKMSDSQKTIATSLISEYVNQVHEDLALQKMKEINKYGIDNICFAWAGPTEPGKEHYYRLHGGNFVVEFDNRQNGANHVHSVWRDVENDFAQDVLRDHILAYHAE